MESFFEAMTRWRKPEGALHLYVLPNEEALDRFVDIGEVLAGIEHLPLMPASYLHGTVTRLGHHDEDITQARYTLLGDALQSFCSDLGPFTLTFGPPGIHGNAVVCTASPSREWNELVAGCRRTVSQSWGGELPAPPAVPHLSLAYAKGNVDDAQVSARLADVAPLGEMRVATLHLVSVTARAERGTFDFTELANWDLGSS